MNRLHDLAEKKKLVCFLDGSACTSATNLDLFLKFIFFGLTISELLFPLATAYRKL